jgi:hypothetical protein
MPKLIRVPKIAAAIHCTRNEVAFIKNYGGITKDKFLITVVEGTFYISSIEFIRWIQDNTYDLSRINLEKIPKSLIKEVIKNLQLRQGSLIKEKISSQKLPHCEVGKSKTNKH